MAERSDPRPVDAPLEEAKPEADVSEQELEVAIDEQGVEGPAGRRRASSLDAEVPEADALEQATPTRPLGAPPETVHGHPEGSEADLLEQEQDVPLDEEEGER